jgi:hypothetical protein
MLYINFVSSHTLSVLLPTEGKTLLFVRAPIALGILLARIYTRLYDVSIKLLIQLVWAEIPVPL